MSAFNVADHMMNLHGKQYLPVAPRIHMMREATIGWSVTTEPVMFGDVSLMKATIFDETNRVIATAHKTVVSFKGGDIEKAETGAIGRALSIAGFGTLQAGDMDEGDQIADSPQRKNGKPQAIPADPGQFMMYCCDNITRYDHPKAVKSALKLLGYDVFPAGTNQAQQRQVMYDHIRAYARLRDAGMSKEGALDNLAEQAR